MRALTAEYNGLRNGDAVPAAWSTPPAVLLPKPGKGLAMLSSWRYV